MLGSKTCVYPLIMLHLGKDKQMKKKKKWIYLKALWLLFFCFAVHVLSTTRKCTLFLISKMAAGALNWGF